MEYIIRPMAKRRKKSIGIFDSGFGGLHVMRGIARVLPEYDFIYLGDTARIPYGTRSKEVVHDFAKQAVDFLFKKGCELIVIACNTVSSDALRRIQQEYLTKHHPGKRVLGVIIPAVEIATEVTASKRVGVIGTEGTVASGSFDREFKKIDSSVKLFQSACPLLVPIVESGEQNSKATEIMLRKYLKPLVAKKIDTLILGCTHYGILENKIRKIAGKKINIVSQEKIIAGKLKDYLKRHPEIERKIGKKGKRFFYSTDLTEKFEKLGSKFFGRRIEVQKAKLE